MKAMLKSRLSTAMSACYLGLAMSAVSGVAMSQDAGPTVSRANVGQALVYPYYTVNDGWITTFNVINISDKTLAVKVRFHEQKNSRDVLDFNIVMSPFDSWTGWVEDSDGGPLLRTVDNSCTSPLDVDGVNASNFAYTGSFDDTGGRGLNRMRAGYVEVLLMGEAPAGAENCGPVARDDGICELNDGTPYTPADESLLVPYYAKHDADGVPRDCEIVDNAFIATVPNWQPETDPVTYVNPAVTNSLAGSGDPLARADFVAPTGNWLKGNVGWLNAATGYGAGSEANAVENWSSENYVTAQQFPWFLEPTFASEDGLWTVTGVVPFEASILASATMNEWADNPNNGAQSDWVVTFPTKLYHVDLFNNQIQAAVSKYRNALADVVTCTNPLNRTTCSIAGTAPNTVEPFEHLFGVTGPDPEFGNGTSTVTVEYSLYDREEGTVVFESDGTSISPAPPPTIEIATLKYESNVIQFGDESVLGSNFPAVLDASAALDGAGSGWASIKFVSPAALSGGGLPVSAFAVRAIERTLDGQAYDAGYVVSDDTNGGGNGG
jgi:hypothetical protein